MFSSEIESGLSLSCFVLRLFSEMVFGFGSKKSDRSFDFSKMHVISDVNMDNAGEK